MITLLIVTAALMQSSAADERAAVRAELAEVYKHWDKARIAIDTGTLESTLGPDFFVVLQDGKHSRQEFLNMITHPQANVDHLRFESRILTLNRQDDDWITIITEKTEVVVRPSDKIQFRGFSLWVTRDRWHKAPDGSWRAKSSEWIGNESWRDNPPFPDWGSALVGLDSPMEMGQAANNSLRNGLRNLPSGSASRRMSANR